MTLRVREEYEKSGISCITRLFPAIFGGTPIIETVISLVGALIVVLFGARRREIKPAERMNWSWKKAVKAWSIITGIQVVIALVTVWLLVQSSAQPSLTAQDWAPLLFIVAISMLVGVPVGTLFALPIILPFSFTSGMVKENIFLKPNEGIRRSARHSLRYGIAVLLLAWLLTGTISIFYPIILLGLEMAQLSTPFSLPPDILLKSLPFALSNGLDGVSTSG